MISRDPQHLHDKHTRPMPGTVPIEHRARPCGYEGLTVPD